MAGAKKPFTKSEERILHLLMNNTIEELPIDWEKAANEGGYCDSKSFKECWRQFRQRRGWLQRQRRQA